MTVELCTCVIAITTAFKSFNLFSSFSLLVLIFSVVCLFVFCFCFVVVYSYL